MNCRGGKEGGSKTKGNRGKAETLSGGSSFYMDYRSGKIPQKEYVAFKMRQADILEDLRKQQESQQQEIRALDKLSGKYMAAIKALLKLKSGKELTKDMIEAFISKIYVYPGKRIEVIFTFTADCMEGVK